MGRWFSFRNPGQNYGITIWFLVHGIKVGSGRKNSLTLCSIQSPLMYYGVVLALVQGLKIHHGALTIALQDCQIQTTILYW